MRVRRLTIKNFRGSSGSVVDFRGHTLLVGGNNSGKSTICEALELVLGPERLYRRPVINEHDFHRGQYLDADGKSVPVRIDAVLLDLSAELERKLFSKTRPWSEAKGDFIDVEGAEPAHADAADICRALPVCFIGWYDRPDDDFFGQTYFAHPKEEVDEGHKDFGTPWAGLSIFGREWKHECAFIYLRTLRTGRRALSLERGSLLDAILRRGDKGKESLWENTIERLRGFKPPIGAIPQLEGIRKQVRRRMSRFVGLAEGEDATSFFASDLTRENLREVVRFFVRSEENGHSVPFDRLGTGAINTLVFALLTHIADLRKGGSVIFAMEEPEIALPPHAQRRIARYILKHMDQAIITSHSPYVIEEFELDQILAVQRDAGIIKAAAVPTAEIKHKTLSQHRLQLAEAILARGVVVAEGTAEAILLPTASIMLERFRDDGSYDPFDLTGISVFNAGSQGNVPRWGPFFSGLGKKVFAFQDKPKTAWTPEQEKMLAMYAENCVTAFTNLEDLLLAEVPAAALRRFLEGVKTLPDYPQHHGIVAENAMDEAVKELARKVLDSRKGEGYAGLLMEYCENEAELPKTVISFLLRLHELLKLPSLDVDDEGKVDREPGKEAEAEAPNAIATI